MIVWNKERYLKIICNIYITVCVILFYIFIGIVQEYYIIFWILKTNETLFFKLPWFDTNMENDKFVYRKTKIIKKNSKTNIFQ